MAKHNLYDFQLLIHSASQQASIDSDYVAGNKACSLGGKEHGCAAELIQLAETMHGCAKQELAATLSAIEQSGIQIGAKHAGSDGVHAHAFCRPFDCQRLGERSDRSFARAVCSDLVERQERCNGRDVDDSTVALLDHVAAENAASAQCTGQIGFHDRVPVGLWEFKRGHAFGAASGVDQNVDAAEFGGDLFQEVFDTGVFGDIANFRERTAAEGFDFRGGSAYQLSAAACRNDVSASFGQRSGNGESNSAGPANYDCGFVCEIEKRMAHNFLCKCVNYTVPQVIVRAAPTCGQ